MSPRQIERFFRILSQEAPFPATAILTGAAAAALWGHVRPSLDIDFAVQLRRPSAERWRILEEAIEQAVRRAGISVNYAEDIDRWSAVSLLDYRRHTRRYRRFGQLEVRLLDPAYWSIGKIGRYLEPDIQDLVAVFTRRRVAPERVLSVWSRALRESPRSLAVTQFARQAEHFLRSYGARIWGARFDAERAVTRLRRVDVGRR
jgi:hypothetical protein